jgi:DNA-binding MarR family transcriptional regulator/N-acetylglutamate synthase-like GNAT family acetyltransferase
MKGSAARGDRDTRVEAVRAFNRFWTTRIGVLDASHLGTPFSVTEARTLFELAQRDDTPVGDLRVRLDLDAGYLSRLLAAFRAKKLVVTEASGQDARRQVARLTAKGRHAAAELNARAIEDVRSLLQPLDEEEQSRLLGALGAAQGLLERAARAAKQIVLRPPRAGDLGWVVERHGALYAAEYGWDQRFEGLVASIVAEYAAAPDPQSAAWIAEVDGERAGCVFSMRKDARTAQLRLLLVEPRFRGRGLGHKLVDECIRFATGCGFRKMTLWTNDVLKDARRLYERAGFELAGAKKHTSFGRQLTGQTWERAVP